MQTQQSERFCRSVEHVADCMEQLDVNKWQISHVIKSYLTNHHLHGRVLTILVPLTSKEDGQLQSVMVSNYKSYSSRGGSIIGYGLIY